MLENSTSLDQVMKTAASASKSTTMSQKAMLERHKYMKVISKQTEKLPVHGKPWKMGIRNTPRLYTDNRLWRRAKTITQTRSDSIMCEPEPNEV